MATNVIYDSLQRIGVIDAHHLITSSLQNIISGYYVMSSLFQQAEANSTNKPSLTKYGHTAPGPGSGLDENPNTRSANQPQAGKADTTATQRVGTLKKSMSNAAKTKSGVGGEENSGVEHFET
ncbi:hypothetical protein F4811DRAFT_551966 [Daldinia bambusicola]|nr:hypothetical protein F4811DRAFT_551966 [Daldinia bambusicola]